MTRHTYLRALWAVHELEILGIDATTEMWDARQYLRQDDIKALEDLADDLELRLKKAEAV